MKVIEVKSLKARVKKVKNLIQSAGNQIGSVWFVKRSDGKLRKMSYRMRVKKPTYCRPPSGKGGLKRKEQDVSHNLITVFDTNSIRYNNKHRMCGRGNYKSVPLDSVIRVKVNGEIYRISA